MEHLIKLQSEYNKFIFNGTKRIKIRLYDDKIKKIAIDYTIDTELNESFSVRVVGLFRWGYVLFEMLIKLGVNCCKY